MLTDYRMCFHEGRSVTCLRRQYDKLKTLGLLNCQILEQNNQSEIGKYSKITGMSFEKVEDELISNGVNSLTRENLPKG